MSIRLPAVAGSFYPADPDELRRELDAAFAGAVPPDPDRPVPKAIVVPHAGFVYSGPVAASAYLRLAPARDTITRVVLLGPSHRVYVEGLAASGADEWATPLGRVAVERPDGIEVHDDAHAPEHSLEVQLPFLQRTLGEFTLVPLVVGRATAPEVAAVLDRLWGGPETLVVVSTDLSHYHDWDTATALDRATAARVLARDHARIDDRDACGAYPLRGLLRAATTRDLDVRLLDLRNSGDTAGPRDRVVGYGAFAVG